MIFNTVLSINLPFNIYILVIIIQMMMTTMTMEMMVRPSLVYY